MSTLTPAERQAKIASYGRSYADLIALLDTTDRAMWKFKPSPTDWNIHENIIHLGDSESNSNARFRRAIAEPGSSVFAYDQDKWAIALDYHGKSTDIALMVLKGVRDSVHELLQSVPDTAWAGTIEHPNNGTMTLDDVLLLYEAHLPGHIQQIQDVITAWHAHGKPA